MSLLLLWDRINGERYAISYACLEISGVPHHSVKDDGAVCLSKHMG